MLFQAQRRSIQLCGGQCLPQNITDVSLPWPGMSKKLGTPREDVLSTQAGLRVLQPWRFRLLHPIQGEQHHQTSHDRVGPHPIPMGQGESGVRVMPNTQQILRAFTHPISVGFVPCAASFFSSL